MDSDVRDMLAMMAEHRFGGAAITARPEQATEISARGGHGHVRPFERVLTVYHEAALGLLADYLSVAEDVRAEVVG